MTVEQDIERGFDAAVAELRGWAEGFYDKRTAKYVEAAAKDLDRCKPMILASLRDVEREGEGLLGYQQMPSVGRCDWQQLREAVSEATCGKRDLASPPPPELYPGHVMTGINYNSLSRIVTAFVNAALRQPPSVEREGAVAHHPDCEHPKCPIKLCDCPVHPTPSRREEIARIIAGFGAPPKGAGPATVGAWDAALAKADAILSSDWRGIESAPFDKGVIVYCRRFEQVCEAIQYRHGGWKTFGPNGAWKCRPSAWMPLPPAPGVKG